LFQLSSGMLRPWNKGFLTTASEACRGRASARVELGGFSMADHNDPNAVNSIFSDIEVSAADLYDLFGFPSDDTTGAKEW
jgi:hypothetical protein